MADSKYPTQLDTDVELIRVDNNITEIGGDAINGLRGAVFNIEETLGITPQGTATDVAARLSQSLNPDGTIKASALSTIGLVTLPITNAMIAGNAGILESKLQLDYRTKILRELIGALRVEHDALVLAVQGDITNLSRHVAHPSSFGRHRTSDIDGYIGTYAGYNLQYVINDLDTRIIDHLADPIDAHDASAVSFDDSNTFIHAEEVQTAIEKLDALGITTLVMHQDEQHSNGILNAQKVSANGNHGETVVIPSALNAVAPGATIVAYTTPPGTLAQVVRGDRIDITINSDVYTRYVNSVNATYGTVSFFNALPVGGVNVSAVIYRTLEESWAPSTLNLAIRNDTVDNNCGSVLQLIHPSAPYILSNGLDVRKITATAKYIKLAWQSGETSDIDAYQALQNYPLINSSPSTWTAGNLMVALNKEFKKDTNNYPLVAFVYRGEVGIGFDEPDGYVELRTPSSDSAWPAFGLVGTEIDYSLGPRRFYIDGYGFSSIRKVVDAVGTTDDTATIRNINVDLQALGVGQTGIVRVKNHADAGTYVFDASSASSLTISSHIGGFASGMNVSVEIYSDSFAVPTIPLKHTLYELFIDGYEDESGELKAAARVEYAAGGGSNGNPQNWFDITDISRDFVVGTKRIHFQNVAGEFVVMLGDPILTPPTNKGITNPGAMILLPTTNAVGYAFRLYDYNNVDYVDIEIADDSFVLVPLGEERAVDLIIHQRISEEKYVQIGQVLHNADRFKRLSDRRLFGTVGRKDIRNDYSRDYISYPRSLLRGTGVIYGCEVSSGLTGPIMDGGQILTDGNIYSISRTELAIPTDGVAATYNIFTDGDGVLRFLQNNQAVGVLLTTPSAAEIIASSDKVLLGQVDISSEGIVSSIRDYRRFVNNIDNKMELLVEGNDITHGSFASLRAAVNYINVQGVESSNSVVIRLRGNVEHSLTEGTIEIPSGVTITGDSPPFVDASYGATLVLVGTGTFMLPDTGVTLKNLHITMEASSSCENFIGDGTTNIDTLVIENCFFEDLKSDAGMNWISANNISRLVVSRTTVELDSTNGAANGITVSESFSDSSFKHFYLNFTGTDPQKGFSSGTIDNFSIKDTEITFTSTTTSYAITDASDVVELYMENCIINYPASSVDAYGISLSSGKLRRSWIDNCYFNLGTTSTGGAAISVDLCQNVFIINSHIAFASTSTTNVGINTSVLTQCQIKGCYFADANIGIYAESAPDNIISECSFRVEQSAIDLTKAESVMIKNNIVLKETNVAASPNLIKITDSIQVIIQENILLTTITGLANGNMIALVKTSSDLDNIHITDNVLKNTGTSGHGFAAGINSYGTNDNFHICRNTITDFFGDADSYGILINGANGVHISDNIVYGCRLALSINNGFFHQILNNYFNGAENATTVSMVWDSIAGYIIFNNNFISNSMSTYLGPTHDMVSVTTLVPHTLINCIINGNVFVGNASTNDCALLLLEGDGHIVSDNQFVGETFNSPHSPLNISGDNVLITNNSFVTIGSAVAGMIADTGSANIDSMNKGQIYTVPLLLNEVGFESDWAFSANGTNILITSGAVTGSNKAIVYFGTDAIPVGATITSVDIYNLVYGVGGAATDMQFEWRYASIPNPGVGSIRVGATTNAQVSGFFLMGTSTITASHTVADDEVHFIWVINSAQTGSATKWLQGLKVTYKL